MSNYTTGILKILGNHIGHVFNSTDPLGHEKSGPFSRIGKVGLYGVGRQIMCCYRLLCNVETLFHVKVRLYTDLRINRWSTPLLRHNLRKEDNSM